MKRRVVIKKLQYVLESTIKKRRKNMKLKKILAQSLAVAMVLSSVPVANFTALTASALLLRRQMHFRHHMDTKICS